MSEFSDFIKAIIDKVGFKTFLFSSVIAILSYKFYVNDYLWAIVIFCITYLCVYLIIWLKNLIIGYYKSLKQKKEKKQIECKNREIQYKHFCNIFNSLDDYTKQQLINLFNLPQQNFSNVRILKNHHNDLNILQACNRLQYPYIQCNNYKLINIDESHGAYIVIIDEIFYDVLAEMNVKSNNR